MLPTRTERIERAPGGRSRLWMGLWAAPAVWAVIGLVGYLLVSRSCEPGVNGLRANGVGQPALVVGVLSALGAIVAGWALLTSRANWRRAESAKRPDDAALERESGALTPVAHGIAPEWGRTRFVAFGGVLVSALFTLGLVYFMVPTLVLRACVQAH